MVALYFFPGGRARHHQCPTGTAFRRRQIAPLYIFDRQVFESARRH